MLSAIEKQHAAASAAQTKRGTAKSETRGVDLAHQEIDMSGELQTIPARHGVATFVPRGRMIKIVNAYGKQVVSTWAFSLGAPPDHGEDGGEEGVEEDVEMRAEEEKEMNVGGGEADVGSGKHEMKGKGNGKRDSNAEKETNDKKTEEKESKSEEAGHPPEQAPEGEVDDEAKSRIRGKEHLEKRTWSSYLPSIPYRSKGQKPEASPEGSQQKPETSTSPDAATTKAKDEAMSKKWSSYLAIGKSFSSYVPNVQIPDSKDIVSAFKASHHRDPNKTYAQQLYDFSRTPVGAASLAAATGSGTASSLYAAYAVYAKTHPSTSSQMPMEYLSLPHTRAALNHLTPQVNDTLLTNLRNPIMTLIEDTTPGDHDTLTAACDAAAYAALGVSKPEEHGSCAENLVLALKELNEKAGLTGANAVGADVTVYVAPTPLHLFLNTAIEVGESTHGDGGDAKGTKGAKIKIKEPVGDKRSYVRFRAERDIVVVMSACPMDVGLQNGGKCMAANFMVEEINEEEMSTSISSLKNASQTKMKAKKKKGSPSPKVDEERMAQNQVQGSAKRTEEVKKTEEPARDSGVESKDIKVAAQAEKLAAYSSKPKKKPKKLERRGDASAPPSTKATAAAS